MEKFFKIEGVELYLDKVFVEFNEQAIFFSCITESGERFLCICTDIEDERYIVVKASAYNIVSMLKGKITMYDSIIQAAYFWQIDTAEDISSDIVEKKSIDQINKELLPQRDATFKLVTDDLKQYCDKLAKEFENIDACEFVLTDLNDNEINIVSTNKIIIEEEILKIDICHKICEYNVDIGEKNYDYINDYLYNISISQLFIDKNKYEEMDVESAMVESIAA